MTVLLLLTKTLHITPRNLPDSLSLSHSLTHSLSLSHTHTHASHIRRLCVCVSEYVCVCVYNTAYTSNIRQINYLFVCVCGVYNTAYTSNIRKIYYLFNNIKNILFIFSLTHTHTHTHASHIRRSRSSLA